MTGRRIAVIVLCVALAVTMWMPAYAESPAGTAENTTGKTETTDQVAEEAPVAENAGQLAKAMEESEPEETKKLAAYQYKKLLVFISEGALRDTYGASNAVYYEPLGQYVLQYESAEDTRDAYNSLVRDYGKSRVMVSLPVEMTEDFVQTDTAVTPETSVSWGNDVMMLDTIRDKANYAGTAGTVTVAVLDTGVLPTHKLLQGRITSNSFSVKGVEAEGAVHYLDDNGHGTHVAGIIADGTPKQVKIMAVKVANRYGQGDFATVLVGMQEAARRGAKVINMSFGADRTTTGKGMSEAQFRATLEKCEDTINTICQKYDCVVVVSAGNGRKDIEKDQVFPACFDTVITVGAVDTAGKTPEFSNYGNHVDFAAPGVKVWSSYNTYDEDWQCLTGTSMASPHVAAAAAVVRLYRPGLDRTETEDVLKLCAKDIGTKGFDKQTGHGMILLREGNMQASVPLKTGKATVAGPVVCTGKKLKPAVNVVLWGRTLTAGKEYSVTYSKNVHVGTGKVTVKGKGAYKGTLSGTFQIIPKGTRFTVAKVGKGVLILKWKKQTRETSGYQVQLCTNVKFGKGTRTATVNGNKKTKVKVKKLKRKKRYYVRIRTFKKVGKKRIYSAWSDIGYTSTI